MKRITSHRAVDYKISSDLVVSRDARLKKLKSRLRTHVRRLRYWPLLSESWLLMSESINQIAEVAFMELNLPFSNNRELREQIGRKGTGTLWDQEEDELAIAILQEEGKVNLCVTLICEYSQVMKDESEVWKAISETAKRTGQNKASITESVMQFEKGIGIIIHLAMAHVEVIQILDIGTLMQHMATVLEISDRRAYLWEHESSSDFSSDFSGADKLQEFQVIHYLAHLMKHLEEIDEDRVMDMIEHHNMIAKAATHVASLMNWVSGDIFASFLLFLNGCFDSETYLAEKSRFITPEVQKVCLNMSAKLLQSTVKSTYQITKHIASFTKELEIWKRQEKKVKS